MPGRRIDRPFGADPADFFGDYSQPVETPVDKSRGRHRGQPFWVLLVDRLRKAVRRG